MQHVFIVGAKSLGAYGGYETFVNKLTEYHQDNKEIKYHVACKGNGDGCMDETKLDNVTQISDSEFKYHNAHCFKINVPNIGPGVAIYYDVAALNYCCKYIKENKIQNPIVYILACRIGPFAGYFQRKIHRLGGKLYINPDGHEWKRQKWSAPIRKYWKISEQLMVKHADLVICDSVNIEKYINETYKKYNPKTTYIAYGAETRRSSLADDAPELLDWYESKRLKAKEYYLVVGRFVPENNYETMIREFMLSNTMKNFAIITMLTGYMPDYTCLITPIFRAYEYYLHRILKDKMGLATETGTGANNFSYFSKDASDNYECNHSNMSILDNGQKNYLNELYNNYNKVRHPYSHWSAEDCDTAVITEMETARDLLLKGLTLVNKYYTLF